MMDRRWKIIILVLSAVCVSIFTFISKFNSVPWYMDEMDAIAILKDCNAKGITIGIIDTGIDNKLLEEYNISDTYNSIDHSKEVQDDCGHGTTMASIVCGTGYKGILGLAKDANIIIIKAADKDGKMTFESLLDALQYATSAKCDVVNISLGGYIKSDKIIAQLKKMYAKDITVVASAGDYAQKDLLFPACISPYVVSVAATDEDGQIWVESNISTDLTTAFPGTNIESLDVDERKDISSGTSEATAIATSYIGIVKKNYNERHDSVMKNASLIEYLHDLYISDQADKYLAFLTAVK